jgi:hypothetical protein
VKTPLRRRVALAALALLIPAVAACGFNEQTDEVYQPATGVDNRSSEVYVLNALIVSAQGGSGTFIASLVNENQTTPDKMISISGPAITGGTEKVVIGADTLVNLANDKPITVTGAGVKAGNFVRLTLAFTNAQQVDVNVPVVANTGDYAGITVVPSKFAPAQ